MKYFPKLSGERIYLSPLNINDADIYAKWLNEKNISENLGIDDVVIDYDNISKWLNNIKSKYTFAIVLREDDKLIGCCGFEKIDLIHQNASLKIFIGDEENRGQGYGKEAIKLLIDYGFNNLNINNIMVTVFSFNNKALKLYKSLGFKMIGIRRKCYYFKGKYYDEIFMEILKDEYKEIEPFICL